MRAVTLLALVVLTACVTNDTAPTVLAVGPGQASIAISRTNGWYASGVPVDLEVNGAKLTSLAIGGSYTGPLPPGPVTLTATCWCGPGRYTVRFDAVAGKRYTFEVSPREEQFGSQLVFGVVGLAADTIANQDTSGTFKITALARQ